MTSDAFGDVKSEIENDFYLFDIPQLIRVINEMLSDGDDSNHGGIFFEAEASLAFPPSDIGFVKIGYDDCNSDDDNDRRKRAYVALPVMNLLGSSSPLPIKFSDYITREQTDADVYRSFLSIMQNRLHKLWIDAHLKYSLWNDGGSVAKMIFELMTAFPAKQAEFFDGALSQLGAFLRWTRSAQTLKYLLQSTWIDVPVCIKENMGRWTPVDNRRALSGGMRIGRNAVVGTKSFDRASKFGITLGPLDYSTYKKFLPKEDYHKQLQKIIKLYLNEPLICELEITCKRSELTAVRIGGRVNNDDGGCLGRTAVLGRSLNTCMMHRLKVEIKT